jgi:hypothetical protein
MPLAIIFKNTPFTGWALSTVILLQFHSKAGWKHWFASVLLAIPMILGYGPAGIIPGIAVGCTCVGTFRWARRETDWLHAILPLTIAYAVVVVGIVHQVVILFTPLPIDAAILEFEQRWLFSLSVTLWQWSEAHKFVFLFFLVIYYCLPCVVILVVAAAGPSGAQRILRPLLLASVAVAPIYVLFPAVGPAHIGDSHALRNCIPSLHFAWAVLLWMNVKPGRLRNVLAVFAILTAASTLAIGEHYLVDLVVAVPYALIIQWSLKEVDEYRHDVLSNTPDKGAPENPGVPPVFDSHIDSI